MGEKEDQHWQRRFYTIYGGQACSLLGSALVQFALIWWLTETTGSAVTLAMATIMSQIPVIVLGPVAGVLVDRWPRKWTLILSDGTIALLTALLGLLFWLDVAQVWHVYVILFLRALADRFQNPAMIATTTVMVPSDQLNRVGGIRSLMRGITDFAAPVLGALLLKLLGVQGVLPLDLVTAALAIGPLFFVPIPESETGNTAREGLRGVLLDLRAGFAYLRSRSGLLALEGTSAGWALFAMPAFNLMPLLVVQHFLGGANELSWLQSAFGLGCVAGGALLGVWGGYKRNLATCVLGTSVLAVATLIVAVAPANALELAIAGVLLLGLAFPATTASFQSAIQRVVEPEMQGRYFGLHSSLNRAIGPLGLVMVSPIADRFGVRPLWFAAALSAGVIALLRRFVPAIYHLETEALAKELATDTP